MKLFQVRKGQFVYYNNELHKVYSVKPMFRKSAHLYRLKDMQQILTSASEIQLYRPQHMDTFIFYGNRYTVDRDKIPEKGDYILIIKPAPDFLDHYALNDIEKVDSIENGNIVTTRDNGIKHHEYYVLVPGKLEGSNDIAYFDRNLVSKAQKQADESSGPFQEAENQLDPVVGDIYYDAGEGMKAMIVAMGNNEVIFGNGHRLKISELLDEDRYTLIYRSEEDL